MIHKCQNFNMTVYNVNLSKRGLWYVFDAYKEAGLVTFDRMGGLDHNIHHTIIYFNNNLTYSLLLLVKKIKTS